MVIVLAGTPLPVLLMMWETVGESGVEETEGGDRLAGVNKRLIHGPAPTWEVWPDQVVVVKRLTSTIYVYTDAQKLTRINKQVEACESIGTAFKPCFPPRQRLTT